MYAIELALLTGMRVGELAAAGDCRSAYGPHKIGV